MTTRLSQKKVKSYDPAYQTLEDQLKAKNTSDGTGGYAMPIGGIPRTDMTQDVQDALAKAEQAFIAPSTGITEDSLDTTIVDKLAKANSAYQKPTAGIPQTDLEQSVQDRLSDFSNFYIFPQTGIPFVDLDFDVQSKIEKATTAYHKPSLGIPRNDLADDIVTDLSKIALAYVKPQAGIPLTDLDQQVVLPSDLVPMTEHMNNANVHITDHNKLSNVGRYEHTSIDTQLDSHNENINVIKDEITKARDVFHSLGARLDTLTGSNTRYLVDTQEDWNKGTFTDLQVNSEGNVTFAYTPDDFILDITDFNNNHLGGLLINEKTYVNYGSDPWINSNPSTLKNVFLKYNGYIYIPKTGTYDFSIQFSGSVRLQIAGKLLVNTIAVYNNSNSINVRNSIQLIGGTLYPIVIEYQYFEQTNHVFGLYWREPGKSVDSSIPVSQFTSQGYLTKVGVYESHIIELFDDQITTWYLDVNMTDYRVDDDVIAEVATSNDGITFTNWTPTKINDKISLSPNRYIKVRLTVNKDYEHYTPLIHNFAIRYISSAYNAYFEEIIKARATYLELKDRFTAIEQSVTDLASMQDMFNYSGIHPEYFVSARLSNIEFNLLKHYYEIARDESSIMYLQDGYVDHFKNTDMIDTNLSDPINFTNQSLKHSIMTTTFTSNNDWSNFILTDMDYSSDNLHLSYEYGNDDGSFIVDSLMNTYYWSWTSSSYTGVNYQRYIAQPFYTEQNTGAITRLILRRAGDSNQTYEEIMICPTDAYGHADIDNPLWSTYTGWSGNDDQFNWTNMKVVVTPNTKYWIVIRLHSWNSTYAYSYWYISPNNSSTHARLRSDNPENRELHYEYTSSSDPSANHWNTDNNYYLSFGIEEQSYYKFEGWAEKVIDYNSPKQFLSSSFSLINDIDAAFELMFASSSDMENWSPLTTDITQVPPNRFLKIWIHVLRSATQGTPLLQSLSIQHYEDNTVIITKPFAVSEMPTHAVFITEDNGSVTYYVSRDDGHHWIPLTKDIYTSLLRSFAGQKIRIKAVLDGYDIDATWYGYGIQYIIHRELNYENITALHEEYTAVANQTIVNLQGRYPLGNNALEVYLNGILQSIVKDYNEVDESTIEFTEPLEAGDTLTFRVAIGAHDIHDMNLIYRIEQLEKHIPDSEAHEKEYVYNDKGQIAQEIYHGSVFNTIDFEYDELGRKVKAIHTYNSSITTTEYVYDDQNRLLREKVTKGQVI